MTGVANPTAATHSPALEPLIPGHFNPAFGVCQGQSRRFFLARIYVQNHEHTFRTTTPPSALFNLPIQDLLLFILYICYAPGKGHNLAGEYLDLL
jgi:hypothetical protein